MLGMLMLTLILGGCSALLALPPALKERSRRTFLIAAGKSLIGIVLPLLGFLGSLCLTPEWKGGCQFGWVDCFNWGKVTLVPLVLWATAAFYVVEIWRTKQPQRAWIVLGLASGAVVSGVCCLHGLFVLTVIAAGLVVPFYVAVWYGRRAAQLAKATNLSPTAIVLTVLGSTPFWVWSIVLSRQTYLKLPDQPPGCFVVTAASRGHACVVGPTRPVRHGNRGLLANRQLLTLWSFEHVWHESHPASHARFRRLYNVWGPRLARRITNPWTADITYLLLKPVEMAALLLLAKKGRRIGSSDRNEAPCRH